MTSSTSRWINVDPVHQQHVFLSISDVDVAILILVTHIACQQPFPAKRPFSSPPADSNIPSSHSATHTEFTHLWRVAKNFSGIILDRHFLLQESAVPIDPSFHALESDLTPPPGSLSLNPYPSIRGIGNLRLELAQAPPPATARHR
jgi:hypothetical protein